MELSHVEEFEDYLKNNHPLKYEEAINDYGDIRDYIQERSFYVEGYDIGHEGGDESVYEDGIWFTELFQIDGWYYWKEPEGKTYGLYSSLESALADSWRL